MNELECMRAFVKVVEVGSFAEAARQIDTAKSVISKRVSQLEELLELQLIQRSTRKLTITDGGLDFFERAGHLLAELEQAKAAVGSVEWGLAGTFKISCISSFSAKYLAQDLCEFQREHPELKIELQQHDRFCDPVQEGFDVCLQVDRAHSAVVERIELFPLRRLIVATPRYLESHGTPLTPEDLTQHRYAHNSHVEPDFSISFARSSGAKSVAIDPQILTNSIWMVRAAVMSDEYIAMMPAFFIEGELARGELIPLLPDTQILSPVLSAYHRRSSFVPMKVRIFLNFMRRKYGEIPPWEKRLIDKKPELAFALGRDSQN